MRTDRLRVAKVRQPRIAEKVEQAHIVQLARAVGCFVAVIGTVRRGSKCPTCGSWVQGHMGTQQTPGIPDLEIWLPARASVIAGQRELVKWETKASDGRLEPEQIAYRDLCAVSGVTWGFGTFADFEQFLVARGLVKPDNIPHYRRPQEQV
jgi:hypothetical protein